MNNSLLDGLYLFIIGIFVVFIVLILILISIKLLTFFENKTYGKQISENKNLSNEKQDSLLDIAAAIAVSLFQKSRNKTSEIAAAVAVSLYENDKGEIVSQPNQNSYESAWVTINRSRMMQKKVRRA